MIYCAFFSTLIAIGRLGYSHCQGELAIDFKIVRPDNTSQLLTNDQVSANSASKDRLHTICRKSNIPNMVDLSAINLFRITQSGEQQIATMQTRVLTNNGYKNPYLVAGGTGGMQVVGSYSDTDPTLGISLPVNTLSCNDQHAYKCNLSYGYSMGQNYMSGVADVSRNLTVTVLPSRIDLKAYNMSSTVAMNEIRNTGNDPISLASFKIGQEVKLTCKAFLGTHNNGVILWRKSNIVAGSGLASYFPNTGEHEVGQLVPTGCQFEKTDSITHNMTDQDSTRTTSNPLQFQCYISAPSSPYTLPETTVQNFYIQVYTVNEPTSTSVTTAGARGDNVALIAGVIVGTLVALSLLVTVVILMRKYRIRCSFEERAMSKADTQTRQKPTNVMNISHERASEPNANMQYCDLDPSKRTIAADTYDTVHGYYELSDVQDARR